MRRMVGTIAAGLAFPVLASIATGSTAQTRCGNAVVVSFGDTMNRIAVRCGTTVAALLRANPQITNPNIIHVGATLRMPGGGAAARPQPPPPFAGGRGEYIVRPGDTLWSISNRLGLPLRTLLSLNPNVDPRFLYPGLRLRIPGGEYRPPGPRPGFVNVTGTITGEGVECLALRSDEGRLYTLTGDTGRLRPGDRVRVRGTTAQASICQQGTTIAVSRITVVDRDAGPESGITVVGTLTTEGVECPALRSDDGRLYTLAGNVGRFRPGDRVRIQGRRVEASFCQQGTTIEVTRIAPAFG